MEYPNIVFIVVDTLRKDYAKPLEEALKKLGFIKYENAIAPASWTRPSHASIFTGLYPALNGAHETTLKLKKNDDLLSLRLQDLGYTTYLLSANSFIRPESGFVGFDYFYDSLVVPPPIFKLSDRERTTITELKKRAVSSSNLSLVKELMFNRQYTLLMKLGAKYLYLRAYGMFKNWPRDKGAKNTVKKLKNLLATPYNKNIPKFIFINLMEVHNPYFVGETFGMRELIENLKTNKLDQNLVKKWKENYPKEVVYVTKRILEIMKVLKEKGIFDNSLIIVTSDHGQLLGEHGRIGHGIFLYDELLRVPLLVKYPKGYAIDHIQEDSKYISLTRLKPFILDIIGNNLSDDGVLLEDTVYAEAYVKNLNVGKLSNEEERKNIEQLEKYRIAIYYKNFKGIFNVTDWRFEEIKSYDPKIEVSEDIVKHMKKEVMRFLKTIAIAKVPKM